MVVWTCDEACHIDYPGHSQKTAPPGRMVWDSSVLAPQAFLVGDPSQLPATVLSAAALEHGYNTSMFERLQAAGHPVQVNQVCQTHLPSLILHLVVMTTLARPLSVVQVMPHMCAA